jgi:hypothetical protein
MPTPTRYTESMRLPIVTIPFAALRPLAAKLGNRHDEARAYRRLRNGGERADMALKLARARVNAEALGAIYAWEYDAEGCSGCDCGSEHCDCHTQRRHDTEWCALSVNGRVLASLCGICGASDAYRYQVECELAYDAIDDIRDWANEDADTAAL